MLPTVWHIYDRDVAVLEAQAIGRILVFDVEALCRGVVDEKLPAFRYLSGLQRPEPADYDEALGFSLGEVVVLVVRYAPAPGRELRPYLYDRLRFRVVDFWRREYGRNGEKRTDSLDRQLHDGDPGVDRLALTPAERPGDDPDHWAPACGGLLESGDREGAGRLGEADPRAGRGDALDAARAGEGVGRAAVADPGEPDRLDAGRVAA
jgi:hypothetical protein